MGFRAFAILSLLILIIQVDVTKASESMLWAKHSFKPLFIPDGPLQGEGIGDLLYAELQHSITGIQHTNVNTNYLRIYMEAKKETNICAVLHHTKERSKFLYFSKPLAITPSYQLYVSESGKQHLDTLFGRNVKAEGLESILAKTKQLRIAVTPEQSYGRERDEILQRYQDKFDITYNYTHQSSLLKLLAAQRVDMVLAFPWVFNYELSNLDIHGKVAKIELTDVPGYEPSSIACAKTPLGQKIIQAANNLGITTKENLKDQISRWLRPEEQADYLRAHKAFLETGI